MTLSFHELESNADAPMDLLLLADPSEALVRSYLEKGTCYTAKLDGKTVAVCLIMETAPGTMEVMNIAVKEELQNRGIGKKLLLYVINEAKKAGVGVLEIGTGNPGAQQMMLYQKCGFRIIGVDLDFFRRTHDERIYENGIECRDMIRMRLAFDEKDQEPETDSETDRKHSMRQSVIHVAVVVRDYDEAIEFYTSKLGFDLVEDTYQPEQDKRWVVVAPPGSQGTTVLLAKASKPEQEDFVGNQTGGRVFLFLSTDDFDRDYNTFVRNGVEFVREPKQADYGTVAVFKDLYGNLWDLVEMKE